MFIIGVAEKSVINFPDVKRPIDDFVNPVKHENLV
jgi:hypothetical protein